MTAVDFHRGWSEGTVSTVIVQAADMARENSSGSDNLGLLEK